MIQEHKDLIIADLCGRLPYKVIVEFISYKGEEKPWFGELSCKDLDCFIHDVGFVEIKPYLFPLSSMTEEQAKELSILYSIKDIISIKITDEYIDFEVDDGFCSTEIKTIWYNEIISSIETFDWVNKNHFDYRGLIPMGLANNAVGLNIY